MRYLVKLTTRKMGMMCQSCKQDFEAEVEANSSDEAVSKAKFMTGANPETHKFSINYVREIK